MPCGRSLSGKGYGEDGMMSVLRCDGNLSLTAYDMCSAPSFPLTREEFYRNVADLQLMLPRMVILPIVRGGTGQHPRYSSL